MLHLPTGTVTFLFTDIEGSTRLLQEVGDAGYGQALADHRALLRHAFEARNGHEVETQGDGFLAVFQSARDAITAALEAQRGLVGHGWPTKHPVRVRMGLHTGEAITADAGYVGLDVHRAARICSVGHGGQILLSEATRAIIENDLSDGVILRDLGEHRLKDLARPHRLFQIVAHDLPADFPPLKSLNALPNNLAIQLSSFIGREREIARIKEQLATARLLTLTGVGGCGKTRLALQVAAEVLDDFQDGVWLIELAAVTDPALISQTVASSLRIREQPGRPILTTLSDHLQLKQLLLLLDNCEHLLSGCAHLADTLLRRCPHLRILVTSREALRIDGESTYAISPLSLPPRGQSPSVGAITQYEAVRLFIDRLSAARPSFRATEQNAEAIGHICHRVDGIPLALELAAGRAKAFSVDQIASRLDDQFRFLTGGSRTSLAHHQTLKATIDWSYDLLSLNEKSLFQRLAVFRGGFTLQAAESVCATEETTEAEIADLLAELVEKSLVVWDDRDDEPRYRMLEFIRQYAWEKMAASGGAADVQRRHRDFFLAFIEEAEQRIQGPQGTLWLDRLETEYENLQSALNWSLESGESEVALRIAGAARWFWVIRGRMSVGREWFERSLSQARVASPTVLAKAFLGAGLIANYQGDQERARRLAMESLALYREAGDKNGIGLTFHLLGIVLRSLNDQDQARAHLEESLILLREVGNSWGIARSLWHLAMQVQRENPRRAAALCEESVTLFRSLGDKNGIARALLSLAESKRLVGEYSQAEELVREALAIGRELADKFATALALEEMGTLLYLLGDYERGKETIHKSLLLAREMDLNPRISSCLLKLGSIARLMRLFDKAEVLLEQGLALARGTRGNKLVAAMCLWNLGEIAADTGRIDSAVERYRESLKLSMEYQSKVDLPLCLEGLADIATRSGQANRAVRLLAKAAGLREALGVVLPPVLKAERERKQTALRGALGEDAFSAPWAEGWAMTLEQAIQYALSEDA